MLEVFLEGTCKGAMIYQSSFLIAWDNVPYVEELTSDWKSHIVYYPKSLCMLPQALQTQVGFVNMTLLSLRIFF